MLNRKKKTLLTFGCFHFAFIFIFFHSLSKKGFGETWVSKVSLLDLFAAAGDRCSVIFFRLRKYIICNLYFK